MTNHASVEEILFAFRALSNADRLALRKSASLQLYGTPFTEPADLIHEALVRCLDEGRHWPKTVPFPVFFANAMKSIAWAARRRHAARLVVPGISLEALMDEDAMSELGLLAPSAEDVCVARENARLAKVQANRLKRDFDNDPAAKAVVAGFLSGLSSKEAIAAYAITHKEYEAGRKRVARKMSLK